MICPTCKAEGTKSCVYPTGESHTLAGFTSYYDENGVPHIHDPNLTTSRYQCSLGHSWSKVYERPCDVRDCAWNKKRNLNV